MAQTKRIHFTPSPQTDEKIKKLMDEKGYQTKAEIVRRLLHNIVINHPELLK